MIQRSLYIFILLFGFGISQGKADGLIEKRDSINEIPDSVKTKKDNFFKRFYRYFAESNEVKEEKKFDFSIIGGPHFSSDTKLGLGVVASGLYRLDRSEQIHISLQCFYLR